MGDGDRGLPGHDNPCDVIVAPCVWGRRPLTIGAMERRLFSYIWRHSLGEQIRVLAVIAASLPFYFFALNLESPDHSINMPEVRKKILNNLLTDLGFFKGKM